MSAGVFETRIPAASISMLRRTRAERKLLLRLRVGDRVELTDMPAGQPDDVPHLVIQGIKHVIKKKTRHIVFTFSPVLGAVPGEAPYCPVVGVDVVGDDTLLAY